MEGTGRVPDSSFLCWLNVIQIFPWPLWPFWDAFVLLGDCPVMEEIPVFPHGWLEQGGDYIESPCRVGVSETQEMIMWVNSRSVGTGWKQGCKIVSHLKESIPRWICGLLLPFDVHEETCSSCLGCYKDGSQATNAVIKLNTSFPERSQCVATFEDLGRFLLETRIAEVRLTAILICSSRKTDVVESPFHVFLSDFFVYLVQGRNVQLLCSL